MTVRMAWVCALLAVIAAVVPPVLSTKPREEPSTARPDLSDVPFGVFLASDWRGPHLLGAFETWLGAEVRVGRTYVPGEAWNALGGPDFVLQPWMRWRAAKPSRMLVLNVPMVMPNEGDLPDDAVSVLLNAGADGAFDPYFDRLARTLVAGHAPDTVIVPGWEMNGLTYSSRCSADPQAWMAYWRRIVAVMRAVPGQRFRFDFSPNRGPDAIGWTACYPGDDVVDIIGMDSYDQGPGHRFADYVDQPYGLEAQAEFASSHGKKISFPEWGLFRYGDRPEFVRDMLDWIARHDVAYHSIVDYCPHGVWRCPANPRSARVFRQILRDPGFRPGPSPPPATSPLPASVTPAGPPDASATPASSPVTSAAPAAQAAAPSGSAPPTPQPSPAVTSATVDSATVDSAAVTSAAVISTPVATG
ncbi:glycosyl hydrolase [Nonomuraea sp. NPDC052265]|uniref:glycoside hydrolase family 26 protein n=1 Tax=Nonomuraea sp. NPDC052265 TaxID=3364374 RepID=UPI0037C75335